MTDAILPVGRDCDCGHPLIWRAGAQVCAVYGRHPADDDPVTFRNHDAPGAGLVDLCTATPAFTAEAELVYHREYRRHATAATRARRERAVA